MQVSVEISLYPLNDSYEEVIVKFIASLNQYPDLEVKTNGMSTQIFGKMEKIMPVLQKEMINIYETQQAVLILKMGKGKLTY